MSRPRINTDSWHFKLLTKSCTPNYIIRQTRNMPHYCRMVMSILFWRYTVLPIAVLACVMYLGTMFRSGDTLVLQYLFDSSWQEILRCFGIGIAATVVGCIMGVIFMFTVAWLYDWAEKRKAKKKVSIEKVPTFYSKKTGKSKDAGF